MCIWGESTYWSLPHRAFFCCQQFVSIIYSPFLRTRKCLFVCDLYVFESDTFSVSSETMRNKYKLLEWLLYTSTLKSRSLRIRILLLSFVAMSCKLLLWNSALEYSLAYVYYVSKSSKWIPAFTKRIDIRFTKRSISYYPILCGDMMRCEMYSIGYKNCVLINVIIYFGTKLMFLLSEVILYRNL